MIKNKNCLILIIIKKNYVKRLKGLWMNDLIFFYLRGKIVTLMFLGKKRTIIPMFSNLFIF